MAVEVVSHGNLNGKMGKAGPLLNKYSPEDVNNRLYLRKRTELFDYGSLETFKLG